MEYAQAFAISTAGMAVERTRVDVAALNLANANTIQTANGEAYQPSRVVARAVAGPSAATAPTFAEELEQALSGVSMPEATVEPTAVSPRMVYEPGHPFANERGFVAYPGVDAANEMVTLMSAVRAYEANVAALNTARTLALRALDIGGTP